MTFLNFLNDLLIINLFINKVITNFSNSNSPTQTLEMNSTTLPLSNITQQNTATTNPNPEDYVKSDQLKSEKVKYYPPVARTSKNGQQKYHEIELKYDY